MGNLEEGALKILVFKSLGSLLPDKSIPEFKVASVVQSTTLSNATVNIIEMEFQMTGEKEHNHDIQCVSWNFTENKWSGEGCRWAKTSSDTHAKCICNHLTSFSVLMSKYPISLPFMDELTYIGLGVSICSLIICLIIEFLVWDAVVKSNIAHFRHTALVNISLNLLIADCSFLGSSFPEKISKTLCFVLVIGKHYCYLAMFFWMLCLSTMLLHKLVFIFHQMRKRVQMTISFIIGYVCPAVIVAATYFYFNQDKKSGYYSEKTCWLNYDGFLKGSIHSFVLPVGIIIIINLFAMVVVISKLLRPSVSESTKADDKEALKSILKAVIFLTPIFGLTWALGFFTFMIDLTDGIQAKLVNYAFIILNAFQGLFILLTGCFTEQKVREALLKYVNSVYGSSSKTETTSKGTSSIVKK
ncbi:adhesion G-protein coupled receptor F3 [Amia ocellicauda]|uniref:adhesion G-protein coupled receptor F3 n=1 Tax=Amia ocellicauda TaxID=2972642 RepID=UPI003463A273